MTSLQLFLERHNEDKRFVRWLEDRTLEQAWTQLSWGFWIGILARHADPSTAARVRMDWCETLMNRADEELRNFKDKQGKPKPKPPRFPPGSKARIAVAEARKLGPSSFKAREHYSSACCLIFDLLFAYDQDEQEERINLLGTMLKKAVPVVKVTSIKLDVEAAG